ncbi:MAG: FMN-binding protein, partial [Erysipelotrichaceae bacterium]
QETALVKVDVEVDIENHVIKNIRLLRHECGKGKKAEMIIDEIKEKNSTEVDDIAGATMSSRVIRAAANIALKKGDR